MGRNERRRFFIAYGGSRLSFCEHSRYTYGRAEDARLLQEAGFCPWLFDLPAELRRSSLIWQRRGFRRK